MKTQTYPRLYIENLGCAKNQVDAEVMGTVLQNLGWQWVDTPLNADLIVVNTCGFIEPAQQESIDVTMNLVKSYPHTPIIAAGCLAQRFADELAEGIPELAAIFGNRAPERIDELMERIAAGTAADVAAGADESRVVTDGEAAGDTEGDTSGNRARPSEGRTNPSDGRANRADGRSNRADGPLIWLPEGASDLPSAPRARLLSHPGSAFVKVAEGCNHACTFCAIPAIRGHVRTRTLEAIAAEVGDLCARGVVEFNLIAQDLAAFDRPGLSELLARLGHVVGTAPAGVSGTTAPTATIRTDSATAPARQITPARWIRSLYLYPDRFPVEIAAQTSLDGPLLPYFDISFQHGSSAILRKMGRPGGAQAYLNLVHAIRAANPDIVLRSSIIVGFPGETEADVDALEQFLRDAQLEWVGFFEYSAEEGTPAARLAAAGQAVKPRTIRRRLQRLKDLQQAIATARLARFIGRTIGALIEEPVQGSDLYLARGPMHAPEVDGLIVLDAAGRTLTPGTIVRAKITALNGLDFAATVV